MQFSEEFLKQATIKSAEPTDVVELESGSMYFINFSETPSKQTVETLAANLKSNDVRAIITVGDVTCEKVADLFQSFDVEQRNKISAALNYANPVEHEQSK